MAKAASIFIIRAWAKAPEGGAFAHPFYYQGDNHFDISFTSAKQFNTGPEAENAISNITSERQMYMEVIKVFPLF